ncbi:sugar phosphate isomerase/epimerase (plasmid) [Pseudalkalibacillus hwajinpoensis]|uniref:sugar phosphate isomerase/epimerase family protein n=1 Tax=Guptibacillus hwajinpoensis TaxID=208199 RepID=UPI00325A713C
MKLATQNQSFFPESIKEKFHYIKELGFDAFEVDGKLLINHKEEIKQAIDETGVVVNAACGGYDGWIGDFSEERRRKGLKQITEILKAVQYVGGKGLVVPAAWGMYTYRLPPMESPRSKEGDWKAVSDSLIYLEQVSENTNTTIYLEPLNRYQDHMINTIADARKYIEENRLQHTKIIGDLYHMNIEEDNLSESLHTNRDLIAHIHLADNHRYQPGSGSIDFQKCFEQLRNDNYQGFLTIECRIRGEHAEEEYQQSISYLKSLLHN